MSDATRLPLGFRFRPTDEELLVYLNRKILDKSLRCDVIKEIDVYKFHPSEIGRPGEEDDNKCYFFTRLESKYPNGKRPNRVLSKNIGHWKTTTGLNPILDKREKKVLGKKRSLIFVNPDKEKTNWHMQECKIESKNTQTNNNDSAKNKNDWVVCCIYEKRKPKAKNNEHDDQYDQSPKSTKSRKHDDHDQYQSPQPAKKRKHDAISIFESTPHQEDSIECKKEMTELNVLNEEIAKDHIIDWNDQDFLSIFDELPDLLQFYVDF